MLSYRYVLHLLGAGGDPRVIRHVCARPLRVGESVTIARHGRWRIVTLIPSGGSVFSDGVGYAKPDSDEG
jgi:hypothetical protein